VGILDEYVSEWQKIYENNQQIENYSKYMWKSLSSNKSNKNSKVK